MLTSVIIVNYQSWEHLSPCLDSLLASESARKGAMELVVVDNASGDGRMGGYAGAYQKVRFVANSGNWGYAHACNLGASKAAGELLVFMNPDVTAGPGQLERLIEEKKLHPEAAILTATQMDGRGRRQRSFDVFPSPLRSFGLYRAAMRRLRPRDYPDPRARYEALVTCGWVSGSLLAIGRRDLEALGGWDDDFWMYSEDVDLCLRAARAGMRSAYTPRAVFSHAHGGASRRDATSRALTRCEAMISKHLYISKHFRGARAAAFHLAHLLQKLPLVTKAMAAAAAPASLFPGVAAQRKMLVDLAAYYRGVLRGDGWLSPRSVRYRP